MGRRLQTEAALTFMKICLMIFNFIFWLTGIGLLVIGIWMKVSLYQFLQLSDEYNNVAPYVFIGTGAAITVVGFFACCCTVKGQPVLLYLLSAFLVVVFVLELGAAISGYIFRGKLNTGFRTGLHQALKKYKGHNSVQDKDLDLLQSTLHCCGVDNYTDWFETHWSSKTKSVPVSCCKIEKNCKNKPLTVVTDIFQQGCYEKVVNFVNGNLKIIGGGAVAIACFQLLGVLLACCLAKNVNKAKYEPVA
ncbi:tetraspanin-6-like [Tachypleus tridentatus]|uniref:tetraspanin-6-like n=1 Tax=Tachypleus tridentatus TaxID=6853 RepID=UPI003FD28F0A